MQLKLVPADRGMTPGKFWSASPDGQIATIAGLVGEEPEAEQPRQTLDFRGLRNPDPPGQPESLRPEAIRATLAGDDPCRTQPTPDPA